MLHLLPCHRLGYASHGVPRRTCLRAKHGYFIYRCHIKTQPMGFESTIATK